MSVPYITPYNNTASPPPPITSAPPPATPPPSTQSSPPPPSSSDNSPPSTRSPSPPPSSSNTSPSTSSILVKFIVGIAIGGVVILVVWSLLCICWKKKRKRRDDGDYYPPPLPPGPKGNTSFSLFFPFPHLGFHWFLSIPKFSYKDLVFTFFFPLFWCVGFSRPNGQRTEASPHLCYPTAELASYH